MPSTSREANEGCWVTGWGTPGPTLGNEREERESPRRKPWEVLYILCILNKKYSHSSRTSASLHPPPPYLFQWVRSCFPEPCAHSGRPPPARLDWSSRTSPHRAEAEHHFERGSRRPQGKTLEFDSSLFHWTLGTKSVFPVIPFLALKPTDTL